MAIINTNLYLALLNNTNILNVQWYTETYADRMLINFLLVLMGKSLDTQTVYGYGNCNSSAAEGYNCRW